MYGRQPGINREKMHEGGSTKLHGVKVLDKRTKKNKKGNDRQQPQHSSSTTASPLTRDDVKAKLSPMLRDMLGFDQVDEIAEYVLGIRDRKELSDYLESFLGQGKRVNQFVSLVVDLQGHVNGNGEQVDEELLNQEEALPAPIQRQPQSGKGKGKGVTTNLEDLSKMEVLLQGRHECECMAVRHKLLANCLSCGRIICEQEGYGACMTCGQLVQSFGTMQTLHPSNRVPVKHPANVRATVHNNKKGNATAADAALAPKALEKAIEHKNKLVEFDRNAARRTMVIDDQGDYFNSDTNQWLTDAEKSVIREKEEAAREAAEERRRTMKVTLDFAGRQVIMERDEDDYDISADMESLNARLKDDNVPLGCNPSSKNASAFDNPFLRNTPAPKFVAPETKRSTKREDVPAGKKERVQHDDVFNIDVDDFDFTDQIEAVPIDNVLTIAPEDPNDQFMCLSMHQPWASLLVYGIKRVEGRSWPTDHRGRLWIASTVKQPPQEVIDEVESQYREGYGFQTDRKFPKSYPTGVLLGCVDVVDCLSHEDYMETEASKVEENGSMFVFVCQRPHKLVMPIRQSGQHKIYKLEKWVQNQAKGSLVAAVGTS